MPRFSAFTRFGHLRFSSKPPPAKPIYESIVASLGGDGKNFAIVPGSRQDATAYAQAMGLARARLTIQRAGNQKFPSKVTDLIAVREEEYGIVPSATATMSQRRAALVAAKLLPLGASQTVVENALRGLLGADFLAFRPTTTAEAVSWPTNLGDQPMNLQAPSVPRKLFKTIDSVPAPGTLRIRAHQIAVPTAPGSNTNAPLFGDMMVWDPENDARTEKLFLETTTNLGGGVWVLQSTFASAHDPGVTVTTQPYPMWTSSKRHSLVVLTNAAASDPDRRRQVNELMAKILRGVSTWDITDGSGGSTGGPFLVGVGRIDITTLDAVTY